MLYFYTFLSDFGENSKQRLIILSEIWGRLTWSGPAGFPDMDRAEGDPTDYSNDRKLCSASGP